MTADEIMAKIKEYVSDRTDDASIEIVEILSDALKNSADADARVAEVEEKWRKKYRDRFFAPENKTPEEGEENEEKEEKDITIDDLYEERRED